MKKLLSWILCVCMMITIFPVIFISEAQAADSNVMTFSYAYDVQRNPAFPTQIGDKVTVSGFQNPLRYGASAFSGVFRYESSAGTWTLTEVGTYGNINKVSPSPTSNLKPIVKTVAQNCGISDMNSIVIHKLTGINGNLVGYGVVLCIDEAKGQVLFLADMFDQSGAGFFLSKSKVTGTSITITADKIAQSTASVDEGSTVSPNAKPIEALSFTMDEPYAWEHASKTISVEQSNMVEVTDVKWGGAMWNTDGSFMQDASYDVDFTVRIKSGVDMYFENKTNIIKFNGDLGVSIVEISSDQRQIVLRKHFYSVDHRVEVEQAEKEQQELEANKNKDRKGTPVDELEPGDYGTARFSWSLEYYSEPKAGIEGKSLADYSL